MFFLYCLKHHTQAVLRVFPGIVSASLKYMCKKIRTKTLKEKLFSFLVYIPEPEKTVERFWEDHYHGIGEWYLKQKKDDDLIITASPYFLVSVAGKRLGVRVIGTQMDIRNGIITGENCHDSEKVLRFQEAFPNEEIQEFYSDSYSDSPMAVLARKAFLVKKGKLLPWQS